MTEDKAKQKLRQMLGSLEESAPSAKATDRLPMLGLYWLFNGIIPEGDQRPKWDEFLRRWGTEVERCSMEMAAVYILLGQSLPWPVREVGAAFDQYQRSRFKENATHLPRLAEIAVMAEVANLFLDGGDVGEYETWTDRGVLDAAGAKAIQEYLRGCRANRRRIDVQHVLGRPLAASTEVSRHESNAVLVTEEIIRLRAHQKWIEAGRPEGDGTHFWLEAEKELRSCG